MSVGKTAWRWLVLSLVVCSAVTASVPGLISYQGRLTTPDGESVADGPYQLTFSIYNVPEGGLALWTEQHIDVPVIDGLFSVILGSLIPLDDSVFVGGESYLAVQVGADLIQPRTRLTSAAYAQRVATVDEADGGTVTSPLIIVPSETTAGFTMSEDGIAVSGVSYMELNVTGSDASISMWEPVDSRGLGGAQVTVKKLEMSHDGIVLFGATDLDTNLFVAPNGDIVGVGQITMGENSSPGLETTVLGFRNTAQGDSSTIGGGSENLTTGAISIIAGGHSNTANGEGSVIGGGAWNTNDGFYGTIGGGYQNSVSGDYATVPGGRDNTADGNHSFAYGYRAKSVHSGSVVWADQTEADFTSTGEDQFIIRAQGGVGIGTDSPAGQLDVVASPGDGSVNLPGDAIAAPEIFDEPGVAGNGSGVSVPLTQGSAVAAELLTVTLTTPADGYIIVRGIATFEASGTSGQNQALLQVDDAAGGGLVAPYYVQAGNGDHDNPGTSHYSTLSTERIFFKPAGMHTFYLEGFAHSLNDGDADGNMLRPYISAVFMPTAYGAVAGTSAASPVR
jgi:hypothetical protein